MTENEFWDNVGRFVEMSDTPCGNCVVMQYQRDGYDVHCDEGCAVAIEDVYKQIKEREHND